MILSCRVSYDDNVQWLQYESDTDLTPIVISFNENIIHNPFSDNFEVDHSNATGDAVDYDLHILSLNMENGARYACFNMESEEHAFAYVITLGRNVILLHIYTYLYLLRLRIHTYIFTEETNRLIAKSPTINMCILISVLSFSFLMQYVL